MLDGKYMTCKVIFSIPLKIFIEIKQYVSEYPNIKTVLIYVFGLPMFIITF